MTRHAAAPTRRPADRSLWAIFRWPVLVALLSVVGLLSALLGDGVWDVLSWCLLACPVLLSLLGWRRRRSV
jgi:hypothetical protein